MARFTIVSLLVILPAIFAAPSEKQGRGIPIGLTGSQTAGAGVGQYGQVTTASETHDKKNLGLNLSSDKGTSTFTSGTGAQLGIAGANQQGQVVGGYPPYYNTYPYNTYPYNYNYPVYNQYNPYQTYPGQVVQNVPYQGVGAVSQVGIPQYGTGVSAGVNVAGGVPNVPYGQGLGVGAVAGSQVQVPRY